MAALLPPVPINAATDRFHAVMDSIEAPSNSIAIPMRAYVHNQQALRQLGSGAKVRTKGSRPTLRAPTLMPISLAGISGTGVDALLADMSGRIFAYDPTVLWLHCSPNDLGGLALYESKLLSVMTQVQAWKASCKIVVVPVYFGFGEQWSDLTGWGPNPNDAAIDSNCSVKALSAANTASATGPVYWMDVRGSSLTPGPYTILAWEMAHNTVPVVGNVHGAVSGSTLLTTDGQHPRTGEGAMPQGLQMIWDSCVLPQLSITY